jgi:hypothetical protein
MKANELRIGNYFQTIGGQERVTDIKELTRVQRMPNLYKGIPLTEQWLKTLGFEKNISKQMVLKSLKHLSIIVELHPVTVKLECTTWVTIINHLTHIKSIHKLQNLYHALTGEELTKE